MRASWQFLLIGLAALLATAVHTALLRDNIRVCVVIAPDRPSLANLYWSRGANYSESRRLTRVIQADKANRLCYTTEAITNTGTLRFDPINYQGRFRISDIRIDRLASLLPRVFDIPLDDRTSGVARNLRLVNGGYQASSPDPAFIWHVDARFRAAHIYGANFLVMLAGLGFVLLACRLFCGSQPFDRLRRATVLFGIYPLYLLFSWLAGDFLFLLAWSRYVLIACLLLIFFYLIAVDREMIREGSAPWLVLLCSLILVIFCDLPYRAGLVDRPPFTRAFHDPFHWTLASRADGTFRNSSLNYTRDFSRMRSRVEERALFLSDIATGYYASAALPVHPVISHSHHQRWKTSRDIIRFVEALCVADNRTEVRRLYRQMVADRSQYKIRYFILNTDTSNRNVSRSCLARFPENVIDNLEAVARLALRGDHLLLFELDTI